MRTASARAAASSLIVPEPSTTVIDLIGGLIPLPDSNEDYTWTFTAAALGMASIPDGVYWYDAVGTYDGDQYIVSGALVVTFKLASDIKAKLDARKPGCNKCNDELESLWINLQILKCGGICDLEKAAEMIAYLQNKVKTCC